MWAGWARDLGTRLELATRRPVAGDIFTTIGFDPVANRVQPGGPLAIATMAGIEELIGAVLRRWCPSVTAARRILAEAWFEPDPVALAVPLADLTGLFGAVRGAGCRIAVATTDDRRPTEATLAALGLADLVEPRSCAGTTTGRRSRTRPPWSGWPAGSASRSSGRPWSATRRRTSRWPAARAPARSGSRAASAVRRTSARSPTPSCPPSATSPGGAPRPRRPRRPGDPAGAYVWAIAPARCDDPVPLPDPSRPPAFVRLPTSRSARQMAVASSPDPDALQPRRRRRGGGDHARHGPGVVRQRPAAVGRRTARRALRPPHRSRRVAGPRGPDGHRMRALRDPLAGAAALRRLASEVSGQLDLEDDLRRRRRRRDGPVRPRPDGLWLYGRTGAARSRSPPSAGCRTR